MKLKLKAALYTIPVVAIPFVIGLILSQLPIWVSLVVLVVGGLALIYSLILNQLKFESAMQNLNEKYDVK
jgi:hypothetical protein